MAMNKRTLQWYIIALLTSLLVSSCSSILDEEDIQMQDKVGITFTLSMNSVAPALRSLSPNMATQYENTIDQNKFRVLAYTPDGKTHEVTIFSITKISDGTYEISGELKGNHTVNKVMILANCDQGSAPVLPSLKNLTYAYSRDDFNPESPKSYIPMWGVKKIATPLEPRKSTHIGTISLLRAMAKIQVALSEESIGCELTRVAVTQYNTRGACVPSPFESLDETEQITEATIPDSVPTGSDLPFYLMADKSYVLYLPEYQNKNNQFVAYISVTVRDINGVDHRKNIKFGKYASGIFANEYWNMLRNHYYAFNLSLRVTAEGNLNLEVKTEKYAEFELKPVYGN